MNATRPKADVGPLDIATMRASAACFLDEPSLPRYETVQRNGRNFHRDLWQLIPRIEQLAGRLPGNDVPANVALAGVGEARRRLDEIERAGLSGEFERVKRLARSVVALCDHYLALTGIEMCLTCDEPIEADEESVPYDAISPSGSAERSGCVHDRCANGIHRR